MLQVRGNEVSLRKWSGEWWYFAFARLRTLEGTLFSTCWRDQRH